MKQRVSEDFSSFFDKALKFLSFRPRSEHEIIEYLSEKGASEEIKNKILSKLKELKFVDDVAFVRWWIEQRSEYRPRSLRVMKIELRQKGIPDELLKELTAGFSSSDEEALAEKAALKKAGKLAGLPNFEARRKLFQFLAGKGYSYVVIERVVDKLLKKE